MTKKNDGQTERLESATDPSRRRFLKGMGLAGASAAIIDLLDPELAPAREGSSEADRRLISDTVEVSLFVNGQRRTARVEPRTTLLTALREHLDPPITGPKLVCDMGACGACTVLLDDKPVYACLVLAVDAVGKRITTVEGLGTPEKMNAVQQAFVEKDALMCGFCTPGFVTAISALLKRNPHPTLDEVREACQGNFCRCGTYPRVFEAALAAAQMRDRERKA
jgi:xanthine dehydrogenase YagT iron-sulfur-binding subunit